MKCGSNKVVKNGKTNYGKQLFLCKHCGSQFVRQYQNVKRQKKLINEYVFGKQTLKQLATKYGKTTKTVQKHLDRYYVTRSADPNTQPIVIGVDCCFFGRGYGIIVARCPGLKQNLYWKEINTENKAVYEEARQYLENNGFRVKAVIIDAKHGIKEAFSGLVVQICQYHQQQIIQRYLTDKPKTPAGLELKFVASSLTYQNEQTFREELEKWRDKWRSFLLERSYTEDGEHWWYTHRRLRAAYRSLRSNLPYLFNYKNYPELNIPNTNNSLEGHFSRLKQLLNNHHGLKRWRRYRLIEMILSD